MKRDVVLSSLGALSLIFVAAPAAAKAQQDEQAGGSSAKAERKICKTFQNSASRMKAERLCLTKADWKKFEQVR